MARREGGRNIVPQDSFGRHPLIRTDLRWSWFESGGDEIWDPSKISYWKSVIQAAKVRGIDLIVILNGPKLDWVSDGAKYYEFGEFCWKMALEFGANVYYYQVLNEHNWDQEIAGDLPTFAATCFDGLLNGEGVTAANHKSAFKTIVNVYANTLDWDPTLRGYLDSAGSAIDIPAIDHYPLTYTATNCDDWSPLDALFQIMKDYSKEGAIMETGYSSYRYPQWYDELIQEQWAHCVLPIIRDKAKTHMAANPALPLLLANWYELVDGNTADCCLPPPWIIWDHFGLVRTTTLSEKPAYGAVRTRVAEYGF